MDKTIKPGWNYKKLNELGFVGRGKSKHRPRNDPSLYGGKYPFIQTGEVKAADLYILNYSQTYNEKGLAQSKLWQPETLLITIAANIAETTILKIKACFPDSIVGFIADSNKTDVRFVKYYIDTIKLHMQGISKGTTQDNLSLDKLLSFNFLTPPLITQCKIAAILSNYDHLIENNTRRIEILEEMARSLYDEWFVKFRFPGYEQTKMVDSELGLIPEGWEVQKLGNVIEFQNGKAVKAKVEGSYPVYGSNGIIGRTDEARYENGLIIGRVGAYCGALFYCKHGFWASDNTIVAKSKNERIGIELSYYVLEKLNLRHYAGGSAQPLLTQIVVKDIPIVIPDLVIHQKFEITARNIWELTINLSNKIQNLRRTRDLLLPKLISGEIDVENLDIETEVAA